MITCCYLRVYDTERYILVQTNIGHTDAVRSIIHIPERHQVSTRTVQQQSLNSMIKKMLQKAKYLLHDAASCFTRLLRDYF
jgi:hypothetical protein